MSAKEAAIFNAAQQICDEWDEIWAVGTDGRASQERVIEIISAHQHPADDGELITCDDGPWLVSLGGKQSGGCGNCYFFGDGVEVWLFDEHLRDKDDGQESVLDAGHRVSNPTRGQLRRLLAALGVTE